MKDSIIKLARANPKFRELLTKELRVASSTEGLDSKLQKVSNKGGWWKPPHNLAVNQTMLDTFNLWYFTITPHWFGSYKKLYSPTKNAIRFVPHWKPSRLTAKHGALSMSPQVLKAFLSAIDRAPTVEDTVRVTLDAIEKEAGIKIPALVRSQLQRTALKVAKQRWGAKRTKEGWISLDTGKFSRR